MDKGTGKKKKAWIWAGRLLLCAAAAVTATWYITEYLFTKADDTREEFTQDGYFIIRSAEDYAAFWEYVSREDVKAKGRLYDDIYLNDTSHWENWYENPPQSSRGSLSFEGTFDGNGYTIYGLYSNTGYGLVYDNKGTIENLTLKESFIVGTNCGGGICSQNRGRIFGCSFQGEIEIEKGGIPKLNGASGICAWNGSLGVVENCSFEGKLQSKKGVPQSIVRAGICMKNEGRIRNCYNLTVLAKEEGESGISFAITDKGEEACYMRKDSGWEAGEGQVLALNGKQCRAIQSFLKNGLYEYYYPADPGLFALEKGGKLNRAENTESLFLWRTLWEEQKTGEFPEDTGDGQKELLREALQDEQVVRLLWEAVDRGAAFDEFSFTVSGTGKSDVAQEGFRLNITWRGQSIRIARYRLKGFPEEGMNEEYLRQLWPICTVLLGEESTDSWEHQTYLLKDGDGDAKEGRPFLLYQTGEEGEDTGFFLTCGRQLYQVACEDKDALELAAWMGLLEDGRLDAGVYFREDGIRDAVYDALASENATDTPLFSREEIQELKSLTLQSSHMSRVESLTDLENLTGLKELCIFGAGGSANRHMQDMWDQVDMRSFPHLEELKLWSCGIRDISFLERLPNLTTLYLVNNEIENVSPVRACSRLVDLNLFFNQIKDVSPVWELAELETLTLDCNSVEDLEGVQRLPKLKSLSLSRNPVKDLTPLGKMKGLESLWLNECGIEDITPLSGMSGLVRLNLSGNNIRDFAPLQGMERLIAPAISISGGQEIGDLIKKPFLDLWIDSEVLSWEAFWPQIADVFPERTERESYVEGDINGDGILDVAVVAYTSLEKEERETGETEERYVYLFLGTKQGTYLFRDKIRMLGKNDGGMRGDPYDGIIMTGDKLLLQYYAGSSFRWRRTDVYQYQGETLRQIWELALEDFTGTTGCDWRVEDKEKGTVQVYAIPEALDRMLLLQNGYLKEESNVRQQAVVKEAEKLGERLGTERPEIVSYFYLPDIGGEYYEYQVHEPMYAVSVSPAQALAKAREQYLPQSVGLAIPVYTSQEIKKNYDILAGVEVPEVFYLGEKDGVPCILSYEKCEVTPEGDYIHVCELKEQTEDKEWFIAQEIIRYEDRELSETESFRQGE